MEFSLFKILIAVVAALAILYVFFAYLIPTIWQKDPHTQISEALLTARTNVGKAIDAKETIFESGAHLSELSFEEQQLELKFECNSPANCCDKGTSCSNNIEWNEKSVSFKQKKFVESFVRCDSQHNIAICTVYFGQKPAQLEIAQTGALKEIDLSKENLYTIDLLVKNSGKLFAPSVFAKARLFQLNESKTEKSLIEEKTSMAIELSPGEQKMIPMYFGIETSANYAVEIRVEGEGAGFDQNSWEFNAINGPKENCFATEKGETVLDGATGKCETTYYCSNCTLAFECRNAWKKIESDKQFVEADARHAVTITEPQNGECP